MAGGAGSRTRKARAKDGSLRGAARRDGGGRAWRGHSRSLEHPRSRARGDLRDGVGDFQGPVPEPHPGGAATGVRIAAPMDNGKLVLLPVGTQVTVIRSTRPGAPFL